MIVFHMNKKKNFFFSYFYFYLFLFIRSGFVITDDSDRTNVDNIYAIGDLALDKPELTPVAIQAGRLLARRLFNGESKKVYFLKFNI